MAIQRKGAKFGVKVYHPGEGMVWVGTFDTEGKAKRAESKAKAAIANEAKQPQVQAVTCDEFAGRYIEEYCTHLEASTIKTYEFVVRKFAEDFEGVPLADVDRPTARRWALKQPRNSQNVVRTMFAHAHRDGLVSDNPFAGLRLRQSRGRRDITVISDEQLTQLADAALTVHGEYGPTFRAMILFAAHTGMRPGELMVLRWTDIDAERNLIHVRKALSTVNTVKMPKNGRARTIILPPQLIPVLPTIARHQGVPYVFTSKSGGRLTRPTMQPYWAMTRATAGVPIKDFYELRHFCATWLLERGVSHADVAVQLGHTDGGALVMRVYGHPSEDGARDRVLAAFSAAA